MAAQISAQVVPHNGLDRPPPSISPPSMREELLRNGLEPIKEAKNRTSNENNYFLF